mgnify:FL=1
MLGHRLFKELSTCTDFRGFVDECLNREILLNLLQEARVVIEDWRETYNPIRPHSSLGYKSPETFILDQNLSP